VKIFALISLADRFAARIGTSDKKKKETRPTRGKYAIRRVRIQGNPAKYVCVSRMYLRVRARF
jgi:hypothetical protein